LGVGVATPGSSVVGAGDSQPVFVYDHEIEVIVDWRFGVTTGRVAATIERQLHGGGAAAVRIDLIGSTQSSKADNAGLGTAVEQRVGGLCPREVAFPIERQNREAGDFAEGLVPVPF
jgi:hypothetical protein